MKIILAGVKGRSRGASSGVDAMSGVFLERLGSFATVEAPVFPSEQALFEHLDKQKARTSPAVVLLDSRGKMLTSEEFAAWIGNERDGGRQDIVFAIGPADGWSDAARKRANLLLAFGRMTMPHELMRVVLAEQVYRAFTILTGHPYHSGHSG